MENAMLIPKLGIGEDGEAFDQIKNYYKDLIDEKRIKQVFIRDIVEKGGGALNCISWTIKYN